MSRVGSGVGVAIAGIALFALTACTPGVTQYWRLSEGGALSTAWCHNRTIDSVTVTLGADDDSTLRSFTVTGPATFVEKGQPVSLQSVAPGWTAAPPLDMDGDWSKITVTTTSKQTTDVAGSVEREEFSSDEWVASPPPGLDMVTCELLD